MPHLSTSATPRTARRSFAPTRLAPTEIPCRRWRWITDTTPPARFRPAIRCAASSAMDGARLTSPRSRPGDSRSEAAHRLDDRGPAVSTIASVAPRNGEGPRERWGLRVGTPPPRRWDAPETSSWTLAPRLGHGCPHVPGTPRRWTPTTDGASCFTESRAPRVSWSVLLPPRTNDSRSWPSARWGSPLPLPQGSQKADHE